MPPTTVAGGATKALTLGSGARARMVPFILAETSVEEPGSPSSAIATRPAAIGSNQRVIMGCSPRALEYVSLGDHSRGRVAAADHPAQQPIGLCRVRHRSEPHPIKRRSVHHGLDDLDIAQRGDARADALRVLRHRKRA